MNCVSYQNVFCLQEVLRKQAVLSPLRTNSNLNQLRSGAETDVALKVMRNVSKIVIDTRERIQRTELEFVHFQRDVKAYKETKKASNMTISRKHADISILEEEDAPHRRNLTDSEIMKARNALVQRIQKRGAVKTEDVKVETFRRVSAEKEKKDPIDTANLSNAILKLSMTPRRVMGTSSLFSPATASRRDACTQADEAPLVKTVVVTVESTAKPTPAPPITVSSHAKLTLTSSTATTTTSKLQLPSRDAPKAAVAAPATPVSTTPAASSSIFSGSLFGAKPSPTLPTATKSSIFGSPLSREPEKPKAPEPTASPKVVVKEEPKEAEKPKEVPKELIPTPTPVKVEETKAPEVPKVEQKPPTSAQPEVVVEQKPPISAQPAVVVEQKPPTLAQPAVVEEQKTPVAEEKKEDPPVVPKTPSFCECSFKNIYINYSCFSVQHLRLRVRYNPTICSETSLIYLWRRTQNSRDSSRSCLDQHFWSSRRQVSEYVVRGIFNFRRRC